MGSSPAGQRPCFARLAYRGSDPPPCGATLRTITPRSSGVTAWSVTDLLRSDTPKHRARDLRRVGRCDRRVFGCRRPRRLLLAFRDASMQGFGHLSRTTLTRRWCTSEHNGNAIPPVQGIGSSAGTCGVSRDGRKVRLSRYCRHAKLWSMPVNSPHAGKPRKCSARK